MESEAEARRLAEQARAMPVHGHLLSTGLAPGMKALDAGCGPGVITSVIAEVVGRQGSVLGVDIHPQRLANARAYCASLPQCSFLQADLRKLDLAGDTFDYVWCQYVLEYLPDPEKALGELIRVTRPGGRVVVSDMDGLGMLNWPFPADLEEDCRKFAASAAAAGVDMHVGRKMFHFFRRAGLEHIHVHMAPTWIVAGAAELTDQVTVVPELSPGRDPADLLRLLSSHRGPEPLALVGHEPQLSLLITSLIGEAAWAGLQGTDDAEARPKLKKSGVAAIRWDGRGSATLRFLLDPKEMSAVSGVGAKATGDRGKRGKRGKGGKRGKSNEDRGEQEQKRLDAPDAPDAPHAEDRAGDSAPHA